MAVDPGSPIQQPERQPGNSARLVNHVLRAAGWLAVLVAVILAFRPSVFSAALNFKNVSAPALTNQPGLSLAICSLAAFRDTASVNQDGSAPPKLLKHPHACLRHLDHRGDC